jgi:hypothetical protein
LNINQNAEAAAVCVFSALAINPHTASLLGHLSHHFDSEEMNRKVYALGQEE